LSIKIGPGNWGKGERTVDIPYDELMEEPRNFFSEAELGRRRRSKVLMDFGDYIFVSATQILDMRHLEPDEAASHAQKLAREHRRSVTYALIQEYNIQPDKHDCGAILLPDGTCPDCEVY
jgi:hypothetical protein